MLCRRRQGRKKRGEERGLPERRNRAPLPLMQIKPERNQQCKRKQVQNNNNGKKLSPGQRQNCEQLTTRKIAKARQTIPRRQKADALLLLSRSFLFLACPPQSRFWQDACLLVSPARLLCSCGRPLLAGLDLDLRVAVDAPPVVLRQGGKGVLLHY